jgi:hypothetical protein
MAAKKPSKVRTGTHSAGGKKRYTDVKRRTTRVKNTSRDTNQSFRSVYESWAVRGSGPNPGTSSTSALRAGAARANKEKSTPTGRFHSGSASKSSADASNKARTVRGKRLAIDDYSATSRLREADISVNNPPGFQ